MTRNFKQSRRDDERPSSRRYPNRFEGEQSPRPARPRLNRESVDRAWENGARQQHHDYRARGTDRTRPAQSRNQGQPYQANRRQYTPNDSSTTPDGRSYRKQPFQRQENRDRQPRRYEGPRSSGSGERGGYDQEAYRGRPRFTRDDDQRGQRPGYRGQRRDTGTRSYASHRSDEASRNPRGAASPRRSPRYERGGEQDRRYRSREERPEEGNTRNPRFQSRPERFARRELNPSAHGPAEELFEGDYERFDAVQQPVQDVGDELPVRRPPAGRAPKGRAKKSPAKQKGERPSSNVTRPSQRGYKWPKPE